MSNQVIVVNEKEITITTHGTEKYVAIKPICEALGVNYTTQFEKILEDPILSSTVPLRGIVASDGKSREMRVMPLKFVFGWLFTINPNNVKPEIKEQVLAYRMECYNALFDVFTKRTTILKEKTDLQIEIENLQAEAEEMEIFQKIKKLKAQVKNASERLNKLDKDVISEQLELFKK